MLLLGKILIFFTLLCSHAAASEEVRYIHNAECSRWIPATRPRKGIVILSHGLNQKPERMDEMGEDLATQGYEVFRPIFAGHCGKNNNYLSVSAKLWQDDVDAIYSVAKTRAENRKIPLYLVAYSFSALLFHSEKTPFKKRIYFAPPLATHFWYQPLLLLAKLFPDLKFPSQNLPDFRVSDESSLRALLALDHFVTKNKTKPAEPTLVWVEPGDELVSAPKLQKMDEENFRVKLLSNKESTLPKTFHHLIIGREALGKEEWNRVVRESLEFLQK